MLLAWFNLSLFFLTCHFLFYRCSGLIYVLGWLFIVTLSLQNHKSGGYILQQNYSGQSVSFSGSGFQPYGNCSPRTALLDTNTVIRMIGKGYSLFLVGSEFISSEPVDGSSLTLIFYFKTLSWKCQRPLLTASLL